MIDVKNLPTVFEPDMKVGDEMIVLDSVVRIDEIELIVHTKIVDDTKPDQTDIHVSIPMTDFENPFPHKK